MTTARLRPPTIEPSFRPVLEVAVVPVPVLVVPVGELGIPLAVGDASERRMVVEAGVEDLVHDLLRLLPADVPHGEDGAERAAPDARLVGGGLGLQTENNNNNNAQTRRKGGCRYLMMLLQTEVEPGDFVPEGAVAAQVRRSDLKQRQEKGGCSKRTKKKKKGKEMTYFG